MKSVYKKIGILFFLLVWVGLTSGCGRNEDVKYQGEATYDKEAEKIKTECLEKMEELKKAGYTSEDRTLEKVGMEVLGEDGSVVESFSEDLNLLHYEKLERFLEKAEKGEEAEVLVYELHTDDGFGRNEFRYDGNTMYILYTNVYRDRSGRVIINGPVRNEIQEWNYTEKGWFFYRFTVPEPPEVSEVMDSWAMMRVKPKTEEVLELENKYLKPIAYIGSNIFLCNWDIQSMEVLDFTALYEYFYTMKNAEYLKTAYIKEIPKTVFEETIMTYLPVNSADLERWAAYQPSQNGYPWQQLGCGNYLTDPVRQSVPEITEIRENEDGTWTLCVDAVCRKSGNDRIFTHEVKIRKTEEGGVLYLGNQIIEGNQPEYVYRLR